MKKTVCELFAGVGGFRCGLNNINSIEDLQKQEKWETVWFSQWEPADKKIQWAHACYVNRFGDCQDLNGNYTTNEDINAIDKKTVPGHSLLVGGFPCQDYSVASSLATSKGLEGKKGVLWWDIRDMLEAKKAPFVLLENVDRLLKSPAKQRGRDFGIILACFRDLDYTVEWRVINAAEYGYQQRRRRTFIFAYKNSTEYASQIKRAVKYNNMFGEEIKRHNMVHLIEEEGFFAKCFPVDVTDGKKVKSGTLPMGIGELSDSFSFDFENSGVMKDGVFYTLKTFPKYSGKQITLGDIMEDGQIDKSFFIPEEKLYYTSPDIHHSDETRMQLEPEQRKTWQYIKGAKKINRKAANGHEYVFSEGAVPMIDEYDKPARTMLTSEGGFSRTTHIVRDKLTGAIRLLTPVEMERIQGFPSNWTVECLVDGNKTEMPLNKRRFMMGNALVVDLIKQMEPLLDEIITNEPEIDFMKTIRVVAAVIKAENQEGEPMIFATQRGYGDYKDGWEFPGGKIEKGETPQQALVREIQEELDTLIQVGDLIDTIEYDYPTFHLSMDCFWSQILKGDLVLKEHEAARWLTKETIDEVDWLPADVTLIDKVRSQLCR